MFVIRAFSNCVFCAWVGFAFLTKIWFPSLLVALFPLAQIAFPFFRNSALVRATVVDVLLSLLLPQANEDETHDQNRCDR
jgi:hypothetical protein